MKILIVDDNKNNRMILRLLLEDYVEDNNLEAFEIAEAEDGQIALNLCQKESFDLVFMDIMMPKLNGMDAPKAIRAIDSKVMIIAVSAVDDGERKKSILNSGAEDYISKPVNADIFVNRVANYVVLIEARNHKKENKRNVNVFTTEIFSRRLNFMINSEDSLSEFWEYYLLNDSNKYDGLSDVIRTIFAIADAQTRLSIESDIYVEDAEDKTYFTLTNVDKLPKKIVELLVKKNALCQKYKIQSDKISIVLEHVLAIEESVETQKVHQAIEVKKSPVEEVASPIHFESSRELEVFAYMEEEDLLDLEEYAGKLNSLLLVVGSGDVTEEEVTDIYGYLDRLSSILSTYSEVYALSQALSALSNDMSTHIEEFLQNSEALGPMCKAFSTDLSKWIDQSFHTGAPSVDFMNDTIVVNCQTIGGMLKMNEAPAEGGDDFDDIFDF